MVRGKMMLNQGQEKINEKKTIRGRRITLSDIEGAFAQGLQRKVLVHKKKYETHLEVDHKVNMDMVILYHLDVNQSYTEK